MYIAFDYWCNIGFAGIQLSLWKAIFGRCRCVLHRAYLGMGCDFVAQQTSRDCPFLNTFHLLLAFFGYDIFNLSPLSFWQANRPTGSASFSSIGDARAGINIAISKAERPDQSIGYFDYRAIGFSADCRGGDASKQ